MSIKAFANCRKTSGVCSVELSQLFIRFSYFLSLSEMVLAAGWDPLWVGEGLRGGRLGEGEGLRLPLSLQRCPRLLQTPCLKPPPCRELERDLGTTGILENKGSVTN